MCINPIFIRNKAKSRYGGMEYIKVPCRNCPECSAVVQNDYIVRTISLVNSLPSNYSFFFCTLTFNNENLPLVDVYREDIGGYKLIKKSVPSFNHELYKRFRKNFSEYVFDNFGNRLYMLTTCEYGEKKHRPHYHSFIAFPLNVSYKQFKVYIERFWHYGFTKNIRIVSVDGSQYERSLLNSIKYITKYCFKFNSWKPFYLKSGFCTNLPPYDIKPKVFCSNNFGSGLEKTLTDYNYSYNSVYLQLKGDDNFSGKEYQLPSYYRRRYFTSCIVYSKEFIDKHNENLPYFDKLKKIKHYETKSFVVRTKRYQKILFEDFKTKLKDKIDKFNILKYDPNFINFVNQKFGFQCDISSFDISNLYKSLVNNYLERTKPFLSSSLSLPIPYINMVKTISKQRFYLPDNVAPWYGKLEIAKLRDEKRALDLPWLGESSGVREYYFRTQKYVPYSSLPVEYIALSLYDEYTAVLKSHQYKRRERVENFWLQVHVAPYIDVA